jgi:hypothetical protein
MEKDGIYVPTTGDNNNSGERRQKSNRSLLSSSSSSSSSLSDEKSILFYRARYEGAMVALKFARENEERLDKKIEMMANYEKKIGSQDEEIRQLKEEKENERKEKERMQKKMEKEMGDGKNIYEKRMVDNFQLQCLNLTRKVKQLQDEMKMKEEEYERNLEIKIKTLKMMSNNGRGKENFCEEHKQKHNKKEEECLTSSDGILFEERRSLNKATSLFSTSPYTFNESTSNKFKRKREMNESET